MAVPRIGETVFATRVVVPLQASSTEIVAAAVVAVVVLVLAEKHAVPEERVWMNDYFRHLPAFHSRRMDSHPPQRNDVDNPVDIAAAAVVGNDDDPYRKATLNPCWVTTMCWKALSTHASEMPQRGDHFVFRRKGNSSLCIEMDGAVGLGTKSDARQRNLSTLFRVPCRWFNASNIDSDVIGDAAYFSR